MITTCDLEYKNWKQQTLKVEYHTKNYIALEFMDNTFFGRYHGYAQSKDFFGSQVIKSTIWE